MHLIKAALAQINPSIGDLNKNIEKHLDIIRSLGNKKGERTDLVIFPELSLTGYFLKDSIYDVGIDLNSEEDRFLFEPLYKLSKEDRISIVIGFVEKDERHNFFNSSLCISEGKVIGVHRKVYLPTYGMFEELKYFKPGDGFGVFDLPYGNDYVRTSILTCEDAWHLSSSYIAVNKGANVIIVNSASPARGIEGESEKFSSTRAWEELLSVMAFYYKSYIIYVNRVGFEDGIGFSGGSCIVSPSGEIEKRLDYLEEGILNVDINLDLLNNERFKTPLIRDENLNLTLREIQGIVNSTK